HANTAHGHPPHAWREPQAECSAASWLALLGATASAQGASAPLAPLRGRRPFRAFLGRGGRPDTVDVFQIAIEIATGGQQQTGVLLERLFIRVERLVKRIKLGVLAIRFGIDAGGFGVRLTAGLLGLAVCLRADAVQLALLLAANLGAGPVAFGAV